jgi:hypothetical protein
MDTHSKSTTSDLWLAAVPLALAFAGVLAYTLARGKRGSAGEEIQRVSATRSLVALFVMTSVLLLARTFAVQEPTAEVDHPPDAAAVAAQEVVPPGGDSAPRTNEIESFAGEARATSVILEVFLVAVAFATAGGLILAALRLRRRAAPEAPATDDILAPVNKAAEQLRQGRDPAGVVEECYRDMVKMLSHTAKIDPRTLTPREFASSVAAAGLGTGALAELTDLFELVRYGRRPDAAFAARATRCITELRRGPTDTVAEGAG